MKEVTKEVRVPSDHGDDDVFDNVIQAAPGGHIAKCLLALRSEGPMMETKKSFD